MQAAEGNASVRYERGLVGQMGTWTRTQAARLTGSEALAQENKYLRVQLARVGRARDILKKALVIIQMLDAHFHGDGPMKRFTLGFSLQQDAVGELVFG